VGFGASDKTNITLGGVPNNPYYSSQIALNLTADAQDNANYSLSDLSFGIVYETNGSASSAYF
jgi:hypothetical protein